MVTLKIDSVLHVQNSEGEGDTGSNAFKACLPSLYPVAMVTLMCRTQYSDDEGRGGGGGMQRTQVGEGGGQGMWWAHFTSSRRRLYLWLTKFERCL